MNAKHRKSAGIGLLGILVLLTGEGISQSALLAKGKIDRASVALQPSSPEGNGDWASYNRTLSGQRYSPLSEITTENVASLRETCTAQLGEPASFQSGITVAEKTLFVTTQRNSYAFDAATCEQKWKNTFSVAPPNSILNVNRGATFADGKVFRGVDAGYLIALDANTGKLLWQTKISDPGKGESLPASPVAWNGMVFIGQAGGDFKGVRGRMMAFRQSDGKQLWNFDLVPMTGKGSDTWPVSTPDNPRTGGGSWTSYSIDTAQGLIYIPVGNASPDFDIKIRPGLNLYTDSIVILDARTGAFKQYYQLTKNDFHDFDLTGAPALITTRAGKHLIVEGGKDGFLYGVDTKLKKEIYKTAVTKIDNLDTPLSADTDTHFCPGKHGGVQWNGPAYNPLDNLVFVNSIEWCASVRLVRESPPKGDLAKPWTGAVLDAQFGSPDPKEKSKGYLTALDPEDGSVKWKYESPTPLIAGVTTTAGGLVITGDLNGDLLAFSALDGKQLWKHNVGAPMGGGIITYSSAGKQYIAAAVGLTSAHWQTVGGNAKVSVYALP